MAEILRDAEQHASKLREDAEERAASTLSDAERRSTAMLSDAEQRSAAMVAEADERSRAMLSDAELTSNRLRDESGGWAERARAEADELLSTAHETRATLLAELTSIRSAVEGAHAKLEAVHVTVSGEPVVDDPSATLSDLTTEVEQRLTSPNGDTPQLDRK
jgi:vacuolar-type H+-ATPase subunit H